MLEWLVGSYNHHFHDHISGKLTPIVQPVTELIHFYQVSGTFFTHTLVDIRRSQKSVSSLTSGSCTIRPFSTSLSQAFSIHSTHDVFMRSQLLYLGQALLNVSRIEGNEWTSGCRIVFPSNFSDYFAIRTVRCRE